MISPSEDMRQRGIRCPNRGAATADPTHECPACPDREAPGYLLDEEADALMGDRGILGELAASALERQDKDGSGRALLDALLTDTSGRAQLYELAREEAERRFDADEPMLALRYEGLL
jgi:hypothetical protein